MVIAAVISALTPIIGGITGLWGSKIEKKHELEKARVDLDILKENNRLQESLADKEYNRLVKVSEIEQEKLDTLTSADTLKASYEVFSSPMVPEGTKLTGGKLWIALLVDTFNNLIRPFSTMYYQLLLGCLMGYTIYYLNTYASSMFTTEATKEHLILMFFAILDMILFQASMSLGWWFGNRGMSTRGKKG